MTLDDVNTETFKLVIVEMQMSIGIMIVDTFPKTSFPQSTAIPFEFLTISGVKL